MLALFGVTKIFAPQEIVKVPQLRDKLYTAGLCLILFGIRVKVGPLVGSEMPVLHLMLGVLAKATKVEGSSLLYKAMIFLIPH